MVYDFQSLGISHIIASTLVLWVVWVVSLGGVSYHVIRTIKQPYGVTHMERNQFVSTSSPAM